VLRPTISDKHVTGNISEGIGRWPWVEVI
jgi:hypothetical protein